MRRYVKNEILDLLNTLLKADKSIKQYISSGKRDDVTFSTLLQDCQDAAISIGNSIEGSEGEGTGAVKHLEDYCELLYKFSIGEEKATFKLDTCINGCINEIKQLPERIEAVFLPYKASMWDSLESVWMAADADPNCDAYVIPIPYYDKNPDGSFKAEHYEKDLYSEDIPVIDYREYSIADRHPDLVFIHNPYDEHNHVTSVHPDYYSYVLKQYTECLVYIPYYTTSGAMSDEWSLLPSYVYADYIVVQTKEMIKFFDPAIPRNKFLPLGSPKFDRVIRLCKNPPEPPKAWKEKMVGKRVFFYNTSIGGMLEDTEQWLKKVKYVFDTFKEVKDACIIWRPHPLLQSTFESMRPKYLQDYVELKRYYIEEGIGIYDETPDVETTISFCDSYIGDSRTSIVSLFEVVNKPIYLLNKTITENPPENWWKGSYYFFPSLNPRQTRYAVMPNNKLFYSPNNDGTYHFLMNLPGSNQYSCYGQSFSFEDKTYLFPTNSQNIIVFQDDAIQETIEIQKKGKEFGSFSHIFALEEYVFIIPKNYPDLIRFELKTQRVDYVKNVSSFFWRKGNEESFCGNAVDKKRGVMYFFDDNADNIMEINIRTLEKRIKEFGYGNPMVACTLQDVRDSRYAWLLPMYGRIVVRWDNKEEKYNEYDLSIDGLECRNSFEREDDMERNMFSGIIPISEDKIVICPNWANKFILLNTISKEVREWIPPFDYYTHQLNRYFTNWGCGYSMRHETTETIRWVNSPERTVYDLDLKQNRADVVKVEFNVDELFEQYAEKFCDNYGVYSLLESFWITLETIISCRSKEIGFDEIMAKEVSHKINADHEGKCGKNVYECLSNYNT